MLSPRRLALQKVIVLLNGKLLPKNVTVPLTTSVPCGGGVKFGVGISQPNPIPSSPKPTMMDSLFVFSILPALSVAAKVKVVSPGAVIEGCADVPFTVVEVTGFGPEAAYVRVATPATLSTAFSLTTKP